ncbi:MAG: HAD-IIB family hydrolase [Bacilli bacterium]
MIKVLATDLDGTLFYPKRKISLISGKNKRFLRKFVNEGKKVILVTGRNQNVSGKVARKIGSKLNLIGCNGGIVIEDGQIIKENCISHDTAKKIYYAKKGDKKILIWMFFTSDGKMYLQHSNCNWLYRIFAAIGLSTQFAYREKYTFGEKKLEAMLDDENSHIIKIMPCYGIRKRSRVIAQKATDDFIKDFGDISEAAWSNTAVEIMAKGTTKASSLKLLTENMGVKDDEIAVVGDSGNDVSLFKEYYENSYVMSNAPDAIKKEAKYEVDSVSDMEKYLNEKEKNL